MEEIHEIRDKKDYELGFLVRDEAGAEAVRNLVVRHGGEIAGANPLRRITLAYKIDRETQAYFGVFIVRFSPEEAVGFAKDLRTSKLTLRHLLVIPSKHEAELRQVAKKTGDVVQKPRSPVSELPLSNEALEKKIEEILK